MSSTRNHAIEDRLRFVALVGIVTIMATGCTAAGGNTDKAGGSEPVALKLAITAADLSYSPPLRYFLDRVKALSNGQVRIEVVYRWGNFAADAERQAVRAVADGKVDLTYVGTRVFDTFGITSLQALQAPMLIDSYALEDAVVTSDIPSHMLGGLDRIRVKGLSILSGALQKPIAVDKPLLGPADWRGITFDSYLSRAGDQMIRALGARPAATLQRLTGLENGDIQGLLFGLFGYQINHYEHAAPYVTANVNLGVGTAALVANPDRLSRLSASSEGGCNKR